MNIIIFGGTGFFGRAFINELKKDPKYDITMIVRDVNNRIKGCRVIDYSELHLLVGEKIKFAQAYDFSSHVSVDDFLVNPQKAFLENIEIPIKNIKFLNQIKFRGRYVYISTDRAICDLDDAKFLSDVRISNDPYGASKLIGEMISRYSFSVGIGSTSIVRFPNLYGPEQTSKQLIPTISNKLKEGSLKIELATLSGSRNYLFISDAVNALLKMFESDNIDNEVCFSGENYKISDILATFKIVCSQRFGFSPKFVEKSVKSKRFLFNAPPPTMGDVFFREKYAWAPKINLHDGLSLVLEN